jgi:ATP-dependent Zn protease
VAARALGYTVENVSIIRHRFGTHRGSTGITGMLHEDNYAEEFRDLRSRGVPRRNAEEQMAEWAKCSAMVLMAGRAAEELYTGNYNIKGVCADIEDMMLGCVTQDPEEEERLRFEALNTATKILRQNRSKVETLSQALLEKEELDRAAVEALIG